MTPRMRPAFSRALALALLLAVVGGAYVLVVDPLVSRYRTYDQTITQRADLVDQYRRLAAAKPALAKRLAQVRARDSATAGFLSGGNEALIGADLQNRLKGMVETSGGKLNSVQVLPGKDEGGFRRITIRARVNVTIEALQKVIYQIETATAVLLVDNLDVRARRSRRPRRKQTQPSVRTLDVRFDLSGYTRRAGS